MKSGASSAARQPRVVEIAADGVSMPRGQARLTGFCAKALAAAGHSSWQVSLLICGDERMTTLNSRYRGRNEPTDVLTFPDEEGRKEGPVRGDVAICLPALCRNAAAFEVTENEEMKRLLIHGLLHLAGMDHGRGKSGEMLALQEELLKELRSENIFGETRK
jgi:probable rRNA maturation factor